MAMCTVDMQTFGGNSWCNISAAYIAACKKLSITLDLPVECASCSAPGEESLREGDNARVEGNQLPKAADIVFVVDERPCMKWSQGKIPDLGRRVKAELEKKGLFSIQFGVIGFSGEGVHYAPHFHTGNGQVSMNLNGLQSAASQLVFDKNTLSDLTPADPMKTLLFVADRFAWRPAAEKVAILLTCQECQSGNVGYYDLQNVLLNAGIRLHMITDKAVELGENQSEESEESDESQESEGSNSWIGLDAEKLFGQSETSGDLRRDLVEPHDSCTILAQETRGTVFSSHRAADHQILVTKMSKQIGSKLQRSSCQLCECQIERLTPVTVCYPCEIPRPVSMHSSNDKFFNIPYLKLKKTYSDAKDTLTKLVL